MAVRHRGVRTLAAVALLAPASAAAQKVPVVQLKPADAKLDEEFTSLGDVRELKDGRVLVSDLRENKLVVADLRTGKLEVIGRVGSGPGEFRRPGPMFALGGDSTLLSDSGNRRWLLLDGARIVGMVPPETPAITGVRGFAMGADVRGRALGVLPAGRRGGDPSGPLDSAFVVLVSRSTGKADTVARLRPPSTGVTRMIKGPDGREIPLSMVPPLATPEHAILFPDGWLAIARLEPYRVDWRTPEGRIILGAALPVPSVRMDDREKRAYLARFARLSGRPPADPSSRDDWPETIPAFSALMGYGPVLFASPDGRVLVQRTPTASHEEPLYDVVDRGGKLTGRLSLPANQKIVGFGTKAVYVAVTDDDGIERLRRHPWPAERPIAP